MGSRYTNLTLYGIEQDRLLSYLSSIARDSYVSPTENQFVTVYDIAFESSVEDEPLYGAYEKVFRSSLPQEHADEHMRLLKMAFSKSRAGLAKSSELDTQSKNILKQYGGTTEGILVCWATHLSKRFSCPALAVYMRDDSQFWYHLSQNGKMIDEYTTYAETGWQPGQPILSENGMEIKGGDAEKLCLAFGKPERTDEVEIILRKPHQYDKYVGFVATPDYGSLINSQGFQDSITRHQALALALGIPLWWVLHMSYTSITGGEVADLFEDYALSSTEIEQKIAMLKQAKPK
jgi:hypothetical protein